MAPVEERPAVAGGTPALHLLLRQELADHHALLLVLDAGEELRAEAKDRLRAVEGELLVHLPACEVTRLAVSVEDGADVTLEVEGSGLWSGGL
jgi:hypothetical protein